MRLGLEDLTVDLISLEAKNGLLNPQVLICLTNDLRKKEASCLQLENAPVVERQRKIIPTLRRAFVMAVGRNCRRTVIWCPSTQKLA
jgi:hypothetical protein